MQVQFDPRSFALGALVILFTLGAASAMVIRSDGLGFPDGTVQTTAATAATRRAFYLADASRDGASAFSACEQGFHMASLWEIHDVSSLRYATEIGVAVQSDDSGEGPPSGSSGWVRTGYASHGSSSIPGIENCSAWTSNSKFLTGTHAYLQHNWGDTPTAVAPWVGASGGCDLSKSVWCVED